MGYGITQRDNNSDIKITHLFDFSKAKHTNVEISEF